MSTNITALTNVSSDVIQEAFDRKVAIRQEDGFDSVLSNAIQMLEEANQLKKNEESEQIKFELGEATNTHDLQIAQEKALVAIQYTVAVRDKVMSAYNEIMNMQV